MKTKIMDVGGDVIHSEYQKGGVTAKHVIANTHNSSETSHRNKPLIVALIIVGAGILGFLADVLGILSYFGINLHGR